LGSFDAAVDCTPANKRLKPPASLIQQRQIPVSAGIFLNYQNQDRFTKTAKRRPACERNLSAAAKAYIDHSHRRTSRRRILKILGKQ
jgi:hypothetical protein